MKCENGGDADGYENLYSTCPNGRQMKTGEAKATDVYLEYPANMNVGDQLKDGQFNMDYESNRWFKIFY